MKLTLDGREIAVADPGAATLSELIGSLERRLSPERVIVSMSLDGSPLDQGGEKERAATRLEIIESLEIQTQRVEDLAVNTLRTMTEYLPALNGLVRECVELFQGGDESAGHRELGRLIDGLQIVSSAWLGIAQSLSVPGMALEELVPPLEPFNKTLREMVKSQELGDTVQLCDILEFELAPHMETWLKHAQRLLELKTD